MLAEEKASKAKKTRYNKNKKKHWRKRIDIADVEDGLDKTRLELRTGGLVREKADHELFVIERKSGGKDVVLGRKNKRDKRLTVDKIIVPNPDDVVPASRRDYAKRKRQKERLKLITKLRKPNTRKRLSAKPAVKTLEPMDIWKCQARELQRDIFGKDEIAVHTETVTGEGLVKRPKHLFSKPETTTKAVEVSHAGASYNPAYEEHQKLLLVEHNRETEKMRELERIERSVMVDASTVATAETKDQELKEGLFPGDNEDDLDEDDNHDQPQTPVVTKPMTKKQRRLAAKERAEKKEKNLEWADKLRQNEVFRIKTLLSEIQEKEKQIEVKKKLKAERKKQPMLSSIKFVEPDQDLQLSSEIRGSLRQLKPEGNLLVDRYKSLQKRCIIEPRQRFKPPKRKYKVKYQEKRTFREIGV